MNADSDTPFNQENLINALASFRDWTKTIAFKKNYIWNEATDATKSFC